MSTDVTRTEKSIGHCLNEHGNHYLGLSIQGNDGGGGQGTQIEEGEEEDGDDDCDYEDESDVTEQELSEYSDDSKGSGNEDDDESDQIYQESSENDSDEEPSDYHAESGEYNDNTGYYYSDGDGHKTVSAQPNLEDYSNGTQLYYDGLYNHVIGKGKRSGRGGGSR
ncbi:hypothetical protein F4678DRAFT_483998 [Xylaria arbuscula]|nr:hypothetical protein F4678DRAFT_483998 [Xylaria arbuscula]